MDHGYFKDRLSAFADKELSAEETRALTEHLEECAECRQELARLREIDRLVEEHSGLDGDDYFEKSAQKIEQRLGLEDTAATDISAGKVKKHSSLWWKIPSIAASIAVLAFVGFHGGDIFNRSDLTPPSRMHEEKEPIERPAGTESDESNQTVDKLESGETPPTGGEVKIEVPAVTEDMREMDVPEEGEVKPAVEVPAPVAPPQSPLQETGSASRSLAEPEPEGAQPQSTQQSATKKLSPPPPPAPTLRKETTPSSNYKQKPLRQSELSDIAKSIEVKGADDDSALLFGEQLDEDAAGGVTYWLYRRDSLSAIRAAQEAGRGKKPGRAMGMTSLAPSSESADSNAVANRIEAQLLEAWYWIGKLSTDSLEAADARNELKSVADDTTSVNRREAKDYLRRLGNK